MTISYCERIASFAPRWTKAFPLLFPGLFARLWGVFADAKLPLLPEGTILSPFSSIAKKMQVSCCGCYSVRTGTIITGIFDIISWIIMLILIFALNVKSEMIEMNVDLDVVRIVSAIYLCMAIFIAIILLVGVFKRIPFMMLPWIVLSLILGVLLLISIIYVATILFVNNKVMSGVLLLEFAVIGLVIYTIMWLVVFSHFQELRQDKMNSSIGRYGKPHKYQRANQN